MDQIKDNRQWMKANFDELKEIETDQRKELPQPPLQKEVSESDGKKIRLPKVNKEALSNNDLLKVLQKRRSHRKFENKALTLEEFSFLLWATQGIDEIKGDNYATLRPVPSGGARHPFETYLAINQVEGLQKGIYRYLPLSHELLFLFEIEDMEDTVSTACLGQKFVGNSACVFIWSCIPYRGEWRYNVAAHKTMLLDAGHLCQNLYLACEAINCGTCAIGAYDQKMIDGLLKLDGEDEFVVYLSPVGKI
nr:SagB/ThcOx family dehydrogenase [Alkaliphilus hydrothermalis]